MFGWKDVLAGLDEGLDVAKTIAALVPGGQGIALGLSAVDVLVSKANQSVNGDEQNEQSTKQTLPAPIQTSLDILEGVVKAKDNGSGVKIDNNAVVSLLEVISKSSGNGLDDKIVCMIKAYINCTGQTSTNIEIPWWNQEAKVISQKSTQVTSQGLYMDSISNPSHVSKFHDDRPEFITQSLQHDYVVEKPKVVTNVVTQVYHQKPISNDYDDDLDLNSNEMNSKHHKFDGD